jgi:amino acid transporter, AAT family
MIEHSQRTLRRELKPRHLQLIAIGGIIGSGYFLGTAEVLGKVGPAAVLAYALGGIIVVCVMLCLGELAVAHPVAGSFITYFRQLISPAWACGVGWSYWLTWAAYVPAEMIAAGIIMESFVPALDQFWWSLIFGGAVAAVNLNHVRAFGEIEFWLAIIEVVAILLFVVCAVAVLLGLRERASRPPVNCIGRRFPSDGFFGRSCHDGACACQFSRRGDNWACCC